MNQQRADLLVLLEAGPTDIGLLAQWMRSSEYAIQQVLKALVRQGLVTRTPGSRRIWQLSSTPVLAPAPAVQPAPRAARRPSTDDEDLEPEPLDELTDEDPDTAALEELDAAPALPMRRGRGRPPKAALRQAAAPSSARSLAWWVGLSRDAFSAEANRRCGAMSASKEGRSLMAWRPATRGRADA